MRWKGLRMRCASDVLWDVGMMKFGQLRWWTRRHIRPRCFGHGSLRRELRLLLLQVMLRKLLLLQQYVLGLCVRMHLLLYEMKALHLRGLWMWRLREMLLCGGNHGRRRTNGFGRSSHEGCSGS